MAEIKGIKTRWWVVGGIGAMGVVYWAYKRRQQASAQAAATQDPNIDPNTGQPYSTEYGGGGSSPVGVTPSLYGYMDQFGNLISNGTTVTAPSTNAAWAQQVESYMTNQGGYDSATVLTALGKALSGIALSDKEMGIIQTAVGVLGAPPQGWLNGAPKASPPDGQTNPPGIAPIATRREQPENKGPISYHVTESVASSVDKVVWHQIAYNHYDFDSTKTPVWMVGDSLAVYNGSTGVDNPSGKTVLLPQKVWFWNTL